MKVLILWADNSSANLGVRVLAQGHASLIRSIWGEDVDIAYQDFGGNETGVRVSRKTILRELGRREGPIKSFVREFDLIWDTGAGDSFTDIYGYGRLVRMMYVQRAAHRSQVPIVVGPQTIGPFDSSIAAGAARRSLKRMTAVFARDTASADYAVSARMPLTMTATDVVFALPPVERFATHDVLFNVSGLLWSENRHVDYHRYRSSVHRLCEELADRAHDVKILVHVLDNANVDNDFHAASEVGQAHGLEVLVPDGLADARQHTGSSNVLIGSRMHACLNALSTGTPTVPWAYSRKFRPLFADIGWSEVVDLREDADPVSATLDRLDDLDAMQQTVQLVLDRADERLSAVISTMRELHDLRAVK